MQTYQDYVDEIQSAVFSTETADPDFLRDTAALYAEACAEVNDRLRRVGHLLRRGHRSEAIQLTEEEPNLLDQVALLDFPELPEWINMLISWDMATPPPLLVDIAADLNRAYADQQPVAPLLRQHRLLALGRAPLSARINVLRRLIELDGYNEAWGSDLESMEKVRLKEIGNEAEKAFRKNDKVRLSRLREELLSGDWSVSISDSVKDRVSELSDQANVRGASEDVTRLASELNEAFMAFDVDLGMQLRDRWRDAVSTACLATDDERLEQANPALDWLSDQDKLIGEQVRRRELIEEIERGLETEAPAKELERLLDKSETFEEPLPETLRLRVSRRLQNASVAARRRHMVTLVSLVGLLLLIGVGVGYLVTSQRRARIANDAAATLERLIGQGEIEQAARYYSTLAADQPGIAGTSAVQDQQAKVVAAQRESEQRRAGYERAVERARELTPEDADTSAIEEALDLATTDEQRRNVEAIQESLAKDKFALQRKRDSDFTRILEGLRSRLRTLQKNQEAPVAELVSQARAFRREVTETKDAHPGVSSTLLSQLSPLSTRAESLEREWRRSISSQEARDDLGKEIGNTTGYVVALEDFAQAVPDSPIAGNLELLKSESLLWQGLLDWSAFLSSELTEPHRLSPADATAVLAKGDKLLENRAEFPGSTAFKDRRAYIQSVEMRPRAIESLAKLFRDPLIANLWMLHKADNGDSFYCPQEPVERENQWRFEYYTDFSLTKRNGGSLKSAVDYAGRAPQSELAESSREALGQLGSRSWESVMCELLRGVMEKQRLDPILRLILLKRVLREAARGSDAVEKGFTTFGDSLNDINIDMTVKWMDPRDTEARKERARAARLLLQLPPIDQAIQATVRAYQALRLADPPLHSWIGWLSRDSSGNWEVVTRENLEADGALVVLMSGQGDRSAELHSIGQIREGTATVRSSTSPAFVEGRPVFLQH
ncbi:hypothetical protein KOR34_04840 [Posidoniimonas corsicana]|uniref:Uncharacterized protein n=1 Tax=Posidoniimonas corsicana TaxID=1938618 RepID=A0A5C5VBD3_9BACT|nr:hypothetical protein [Posidoniimonas corsicana]TWT35591.1 hypothetical protein KOR34_04840 [Posidoniimonas corsicana]